MIYGDTWQLRCQTDEQDSTVTLRFEDHAETDRRSCQ